MTSSNRRGFTLIELLVVIAMIAILTGVVSSSVSAAQTRARIQKATNDVKVLTQAILSYESFGDHELENQGGVGKAGVDVDSGSIGFLLGGKTASGTGGQSSQKVPALITAALQADGTMRDPWGTPYKLHIEKKTAALNLSAARSQLSTGFCIPNFYRLGKDERMMPDNSGSGGSK